jgi:hypothetical protein
MKTLEDIGPTKLLESEQQRIRYAADNLIFSTDLNIDVQACDALEDVAALCRALVESGRWEQAPRCASSTMSASAVRPPRSLSRPPSLSSAPGRGNSRRCGL